MNLWYVFSMKQEKIFAQCSQLWWWKYKCLDWRETCGTFVLSSISKKTSMPSSTSQSVCSTICLEALWRKSRRSVQCQLKYLKQYPLASPVLMVSETASALSSFHQYHLKTLNKIIITTERRQGAAGEGRKCYKWLESPSQLDSRLEPNVGAPLVCDEENLAKS